MSRYAVSLRDFQLLRESLTLSKVQQAVLVGSILGDGYIQLSKNGQSARLNIRNSAKSKDYVQWKYQFFKEWSPRGLIEDDANNSIYFNTLFHPELLVWRNKFYQNGRKVVPHNIDKLLVDPLTIAIWFMDDGNGYRRNKALRISSYCFTGIENELLRKCLDNNFKIETTIYKDSKGYQLYIPVKSAIQLLQLIRAHIHPVMEYKFTRLNPVETTR